jgi:hypothetical protein
MQTLTLTNDFHNTSVTLRVKGGHLSAGQVARARRELCGVDDCTCSGDVGTRGPQYLEGRRIVLASYYAPDGRLQYVAVRHARSWGE